MPNIKPISDLRNYSDVLRYAIIDIQDYEKTRATLKLMDELAKGKLSGGEKERL